MQDLRKPSWLNKKIVFSDVVRVKNILRDLNIHTVCEEASCPNISECFSHNIATFFILGSVCTRTCSFCNVNKGKPTELDLDKGLKIAKAVEKLGLRHVVVTSPTRDDLKDGGASIYVSTIELIRKLNKNTSIEVLIPDLYRKKGALELLVKSKPEIIAHNLETVKRLQGPVRNGATYDISLKTLKKVKELDPNIKTKSALMLGLGEKKEEVYELFADLLDISCEYISIGQYLAPSKAHISVKEYVSIEDFNAYKQKAIEMGFAFVKSSPYTRSSYMAHEYMEKNPPLESKNERI